MSLESSSAPSSFRMNTKNDVLNRHHSASWCQEQERQQHASTTSTSTTPAICSSVTEQYLLDPVEWGSIAQSSVAIMTPPAHVLAAAVSLYHSLDSNTEQVACPSTEVAYVIVMQRRPRKPPPPKFRLVIEDDDEDDDDSAAVPYDDVHGETLLGLNAIVVPESLSRSTTLETTHQMAASVESLLVETTTTSTTPQHPAFRLVLEDDDDDDQNDIDICQPTTTMTSSALFVTTTAPEPNTTDNNSAATPPPLVPSSSAQQQLSLEPVLENDDEEQEDEITSVLRNSGSVTERHQTDSNDSSPGQGPARNVSETEPDRQEPAPATTTTTAIATTPQQPDPTDLASKILHQLVASEKQSRKLELQLRQSGVSVITDDISYAHARQKIAEIANRMNEIDETSAEYFTLEQEMEKYNTAILLTDEYHQEQDFVEHQWEQANAAANAAALEYVRRHMPVEIRSKTVDELTADIAVGVSPDLLKRFKRTNGITLLRVNPIAIERMHPSTLENLRTSGLTLTERRALYAHLRPVGRKWQTNKGDIMMERKYCWFTMLRNNFRDALCAYEGHVKQYPTSSDGACQCRFPRACPVMADAMLGYTVAGAGQPAAAEYEPMEIMTASRFSFSFSDREQTGSATTTTIAGTTATSNCIGTSSTEQQEQQQQQQQQAVMAVAASTKSKRREELRRFYKGSLRNFSDASACCETMDDLIENITYQTTQWGTEADNDMVTIISKMKGISSEVKLALQGLLSTRFRHGATTNTASPMEYDLLRKVGRESLYLCDQVEERVKSYESKMIQADTKGTVITTTAIRILVGEIVNVDDSFSTIGETGDHDERSTYQ